MILIKSAQTLTGQLEKLRNKGQSIGFVPTMGALHQGHLSLLEEARKGNDRVVCSIFVNPTQFNDPGDFKKYPVTLEKDLELLEATGTHLVFLPTVTEMYPAGTHQLPVYPLGFLENVLEGRYRPGHFQGVCQVMDRLLDLIHPQDLYMGQKDYQQCMVVNKLMEIRKWNTRLHPCETLRESDGLAMSSRNLRLDEAARKKAVLISKVLQNICTAIRPGPIQSFSKNAEQVLAENGFKVDYVAIAAADSLEILADWDGKRSLVTLAAAWLGEVRLIDNMLIPVSNK